MTQTALGKFDSFFFYDNVFLYLSHSAEISIITAAGIVQRITRKCLFDLSHEVIATDVGDIFRKAGLCWSTCSP